MFRRPKMETPEPTATPDPADIANRRETERRRRTLTGGRQSTVLGTAARAAGGPRPTLTGVGG